MLLIYRVKKETTTENQSQLTQPVAYRKRMRHVGMFPSLSLLEDWALSSVQSLSRVRLFATPQTAALQAPLSITNSQSLLKLMYIMQNARIFSLYAEYIMGNSQLDEAQAGVKIARRNINNLRYADDTTLMAESQEELKSLLMKVKEESEKAS